MNNEENKLIFLSKQGDPEAFESLIAPYRKKITQHCYQIVKDEQLAEDVAQETFIKAYQHLDEFQQKSKFYTWIYRIAHNLSINALRKKRKIKEEIFNEAISKAPSSSIFSESEDLKSKNFLEEGLSQLPEKQQIVLKMFDIEGIPHKEIAKRLGISPGTVRSRLHYARKKMRKFLQDRL